MVYVSASQKSAAKYLLRAKNSKGTNEYLTIGTTTGVSLAGARKLALQLKQSRAENSASVKSNGAASIAAKGEMTLERFFQDLYLPHAKIHKRSWNKDESLWRCRLSKAFGHLHLPDVKRLQVMKFHNEILAGGLSAAQSRHHVVLMARLLSLAVAWELLEKNVLKGVELAPLDNFRDTFLSEEETARLVQVLTTDSNKLVCAILLTLLNTGARKMEVMKAEWSHIELENRLWTVPSALSKNRKTKTMVLADSTVQILMSLDSRGESKYVFPNPETGKPMTTISRVWYRLRKQAGINPNMRIHDTRSSLAQRLLAKNVSLEVVARTLGNNPSMAYARYARFSTKTMLDAANAGSIPMPQFEGPKLQEAANAGSVIVPRVDAKAA
jgi:integrase